MGMIMATFRKIDVEDQMELVRVFIEDYIYFIEELINSFM